MNGLGALAVVTLGPAAAFCAAWAVTEVAVSRRERRASIAALRKALAPPAIETEPETATPEDVLERLDGLRDYLHTLTPAARDCARSKLFERWADGHPFVHASSAPVLRCAKRGES